MKGRSISLESIFRARRGVCFISSSVRFLTQNEHVRRSVQQNGSLNGNGRQSNRSRESHDISLKCQKEPESIDAQQRGNNLVGKGKSCGLAELISWIRDLCCDL